MSENIGKPSIHSRTPEPPAGLFDRVIARIRAERDLLMLKRRVAFFCIASLGFLAALVPVFSLMRSEFTSSGFAYFFSLIFSDPDFVMDSWGDYGLSLLESLPTASITVFLATVFAFLGFLKLAAGNAESMVLHSKLLRSI